MPSFAWNYELRTSELGAWLYREKIKQRICVRNGRRKNCEDVRVDVTKEKKNGYLWRCAWRCAFEIITVLTSFFFLHMQTAKKDLVILNKLTLTISRKTSYLRVSSTQKSSRILSWLVLRTQKKLTIILFIISKRSDLYFHNSLRNDIIGTFPPIRTFPQSRFRHQICR